MLGYGVEVVTGAGDASGVRWEPKRRAQTGRRDRYGPAMRALILHGPATCALMERPRPTAGPGDVVVAIDAALTCATDTKILARGEHPRSARCRRRSGTRGRPAPRGGRRPGRRRRWVTVSSSPTPRRVGRASGAGRGAKACAGDISYLSGTYADILRGTRSHRDRRTSWRSRRARPGTGGPRPSPWPARSAAPSGRSHGPGSGRRPRRRAAGAGGRGALARRGCEVIVCDPHPRAPGAGDADGRHHHADAPRDASAARRDPRTDPGGLGAHVAVAAVGAVAVWEAAVALSRPGGEANLHGGPALERC